MEMRKCPSARLRFESRHCSRGIKTSYGQKYRPISRFRTGPGMGSFLGLVIIVLIALLVVKMGSSALQLSGVSRSGKRLVQGAG